MIRILKGILAIAAVLGVGIVGYAYLGDLTPETRTVNEPVVLDAAD